jgi:Tol biopolymer transport system component
VKTAGCSPASSARSTRALALAAALVLAWAVIGCGTGGASTGATGTGATGTGPAGTAAGAGHEVPHRGQWGIYWLDLTTQQTRLVYDSSDEINGSALRLNAAGDTLAYASKPSGSDDKAYEIATVKTDGTGFARLTSNSVMDVYPAWSPDGSRLAYLSMPGPTMQIRLMSSDGSNGRLLYDPGAGQQAGDPHWVGHTIAFTRASAVWTMTDDGKSARQVTHPPNAGKWGKAPLPAGDYDPRLSPDGARIVFERLVDTASANGGYDLFAVHVDGSGETRLTNTAWAQGLATYANAGDQILWLVAAIGGQGKYRLYVMDADGGNSRDVTPSYYPPGFLCHAAVFAKDDRSIYFVGQWWQ